MEVNFAPRTKAGMWRVEISPQNELQIETILVDKRIDEEEKLHLIYLECLTSLGKKLSEAKLKCLIDFIHDPYITRNELIANGHSEQISSGTRKILERINVNIPKGPKCKARLRLEVTARGMQAW